MCVLVVMFINVVFFLFLDGRNVRYDGIMGFFYVLFDNLNEYYFLGSYFGKN